MVKKTLMFFCVFLLAGGSCASTFPYKFYNIELPSYEKGKLIGEDPDDDLPISNCQPDETNKGKCTIFLINEHERFVTDYIETKDRLKQCEEQLKVRN